MYSAKIQQQQIKIDAEFVPTIISELYFSTKKESVDLICNLDLKKSGADSETSRLNELTLLVMSVKVLPTRTGA